MVVSGRATFTLDGEEVEAPAGTLVHLPDPAVRRTAVAAEPGTAVLALGAKRGEAFQPSPWELYFRAGRLSPDEAVQYYVEHRGEFPEHAGVDYNLACFRALAGDREGAVADFRRAFERSPDDVRTWAANDSDLDSIRAEVDAILG